MPQLVVMGAVLRCSFGTTPSSLMATPENKVLASKLPVATIMDSIPGKNILPFGMCTTVSNPQVASATASASGVLTPQPCMPVITGPWAPPSPTTLIGGKPALNKNCKALCAWGGVITVASPGQTTVNSK